MDIRSCHCQAHSTLKKTRLLMWSKQHCAVYPHPYTALLSLPFRAPTLNPAEPTPTSGPFHLLLLPPESSLITLVTECHLFREGLPTTSGHHSVLLLFREWTAACHCAGQ